jgi:hypothetical protein
MKKGLRNGRSRVPHFSGEVCFDSAFPDAGLHLRDEESL